MPRVTEPLPHGAQAVVMRVLRYMYWGPRSEGPGTAGSCAEPGHAKGAQPAPLATVPTGQ